MIVNTDGQPFKIDASAFGYDSEQYQYHDGEKYAGGLGPIPIIVPDYWALRQRSAAFFKTNPYGRGIIRRLVTNVINTGLSLEADPIASLIELDEDSAAEWSITVEDKFQAWASLPHVCDWTKTSTFGEMERDAYREALVEGDVLVIEHHNPQTQLPSYELVSGSMVTTPLGASEQKVAKGHTIEYGVELNARREQVAYYVLQEDFSHKRIPAKGRNGRRISWLYYATDKRRDDVRGEPLLALVMQSVSEIDKYRDNTQRKATINAIMAMFFYQSTDSKAPNSRPITAGANRRVQGSVPVGDGSDYKINMAEMAPGLVYDFLPPGVEPKAFTADGTDEKFGDFEDAILSAIAWSLEMPKSVLKMEFSNSYSASRGEIKEFNMFLNQARDRYADTMTRIVYRSWLVAMALTRRVTAPGLLEAWRDPMMFETFGAWTHSNWYGAVKEAVDLPKEVTGYKMMAEEGYTTNNVASRSLTGTRFTTNIKRVAKENQLKAAAMTPLLELQEKFGAEAVNAIMQASGHLRLVANSGDQIDA